MGMQASVGRRRAPVWLALGAAAAVGGACVPVARGRVTPMAPDVRGVVRVGGAPRAGVPLRLVLGAGGECTPPAAEDTSRAGGAFRLRAARQSRRASGAEGPWSVCARVRGAWAVVHEYTGGAWSGTYSIDVAVPADSAASRER